MRLEVDYVYCDVHGEIHSRNTHHDSGGPHHHEEGRPVWLQHGDAGEVEVEPPQCLPANWRKVWIGAEVRVEDCTCRCHSKESPGSCGCCS